MKIGLQLGFLCIMLASGATAQPTPAPLQQAAIFLRVAAYERSVADGTKAPVLVVVGSGDEATEMAAAFSALAGRFTISGRRMEVVRVRTLESSALARLVERAPLIYLASDATHLAGPIAALGGFTFCRQTETGCAIALEAFEGQTRLVVDLRAVQTAHLSLDARVLRSARVIR